MPPKSDPHRRAAELLARPFSKGRGRGSAPLSFRLLPDGGMVVITADGRKLWFSAEEVKAVIDDPDADAPASASVPQTARSRFKPAGLLPRQEAPEAYNGMPALIVLPPAARKKHSNGESS